MGPSADEGTRRAPEFLERGQSLGRCVVVLDGAQSSHPLGPSIWRIFRV